jgi:hypothetical protein
LKTKKNIGPKCVIIKIKEPKQNFNKILRKDLEKKQRDQF